jgi:hypothetical protein
MTVAELVARAEREPDFADVLAALVDTPVTAAGDYAHVAARALSDRRRADAVSTFRAGALRTAEVQELLGVRTPQAVHRLRSRGKLVGRQLGNATWFPSWQFARGGVRPDLDRVLELLGRFSTDAVAADRVMRLVREELGGRSIAEALDRPKLAPAAWALLAGLSG